MSTFDELCFLIEKTSKKQQHRMDNFLKRHKYDPKTRTIETDEVGEDGKKIRVKLNLTNGPVFSDETISTYINGEYKGSTINMPLKTLKRKPMVSDGVLKHEEGHVSYNKNPEKYNDIYNKAKKAIEDDDNDKTEHGKSPDEYVADWYSATHSKYGKSGFSKMINCMRTTEKSVKDSIKKLNKSEISTEEMKKTQEIVDEYKDAIKAMTITINSMKKNGENVNAFEQFLKRGKEELKKAEDEMAKYKTDESRNKTREQYRSEIKKNASYNNNEMNLRQKFIKDHVKESTDMLLNIYESEMNGNISEKERDCLIRYLNHKLNSLNNDN